MTQELSASRKTIVGVQFLFGAVLTFGTFSISGIGLSAVVGVLLNLLLPKTVKE